jgi:two-component system, NarL family, invasion response regulator UvrY
MISILICDDHAIVRKGLKQIVEECKDITVAAEAGSGEEVLMLIGKEDFDVVVLDIVMEGIGGIETLKELKHRKPKLPVLVLSMHPEDQYALRVLKAGASGYLTKKSAPDELVNAIRTIASGKKYITATTAEALASCFDVDKQTLPHESLSDREYQVLIALTTGRGITEIAESLGLSVKTISTYKTRIFEKLNTTNTAEMIRYAMEHNLK